MRTDHVPPGPRRSHRDPSPLHGHRPTGAWFARGIIVTLCLLSGTAIAPRAAKAGITYTWHEDDGQNVNGSMTVLSAAQLAGQILISDVTSFTFTTPLESFSTQDLSTSSFPLPISTMDAAPTSTATSITAAQDEFASIILPFDANWSTPHGEVWLGFIASLPGEIFNGDGHWSITVATTVVPEPSSAVLAVFGAVSSFGYVLVRKRRAQRRLGAGGQPQPTE